MSEPTRLSVFYSWQSDLPNESNRAFIRKSLRAASSIIESNNTNIIVEIDEATRSVSGSPNIPATILAKIKVADVFVCDVSTINNEEKGRKTPNPNVVFELGYATANLGWERVILLFNDTCGNLSSDLPFDFDRHRVTVFRSTNPPTEKQSRKLNKLLEAAVKSVIDNNPEKPNSTDSPEEKKRARDIQNIQWVLSTLHLPTLDQHVLDSPHSIMDKVVYFWDGFNSVMSNSLFHLYDKELFGLLREYHEAFGETLSYEECYQPNVSGSAYIFTNPGDLTLSDEKEVIWEAIKSSGDRMHNLIGLILAKIRSDYLEINIDETNREAWVKYVQFKREEADALESDT